MNIGVITTSFPRWPGDYAGSFVEERVRQLLRAGHTVEVVAAGEAGQQSPAASPSAVRGPARGRSASDEPESMDGALGTRARLVRVPVPRAAATVPNLFYEEGAPEVLERGLASAWLQAAAFCAGVSAGIAARASAWDTIEAHWLLPCAVLACATRRRQRAPNAPPVSAYAHSGDVALLERLVGGAAVARWLGRELEVVTFASADLRRRFAALAGGPIGARLTLAAQPLRGQDVSSATATSATSATPGTSAPRSATRPGAAGPLVLAIGRLVPIKGFDLLLRATAVAEARSGATAVVVILGDGPERSRLTRSAERLGLDLRLPGFVPRAEIATWLGAADVYVQPSRRLWNGRTEGLPVSTLEALAHGTPVITSDSGGLGELGAGGAPPASVLRVFPAGDHTALGALLTELLSPAGGASGPPGARKAGDGEVSAA